MQPKLRTAHRALVKLATALGSGGSDKNEPALSASNLTRAEVLS